MKATDKHQSVVTDTWTTALVEVIFETVAKLL